MRFAADYKLVTARKILKLFHRSFRCEDENQYQLTHLNYLQQLDYLQYKDENMDMFWDEFKTRMVAYKARHGSSTSITSTPDEEIDLYEG